MQKLNRGTSTNREYRYADCLVYWEDGYWVALEPKRYSTREDGLKVIAREKGIKPMRDKLHAMKMAKEGPWF